MYHPKLLCHNGTNILPKLCYQCSILLVFLYFGLVIFLYLFRMYWNYISFAFFFLINEGGCILYQKYRRRVNHIFIPFGLVQISDQGTDSNMISNCLEFKIIGSSMIGILQPEHQKPIYCCQVQFLEYLNNKKFLQSEFDTF